MMLISKNIGELSNPPLKKFSDMKNFYCVGLTYMRAFAEVRLDVKVVLQFIE